VSWTGKLEEISIPELLHTVAWGEKTGKLVFTRQDAEGLIVLRKGRIIYAASNAPREVLGNILLCKRLITPETLLAALEEQNRSQRARLLGAILIDMGAITVATLEAVIREQIETVMAEFFLWDFGFFRFDAVDLSGSDELEVDARDFVLHRGFKIEQVVLEVVKRVDDAKRRREEYAAATRPGRPHSPGEIAPAGTAQGPAARPAAPLSAIMAELRSPTLRGEATLKILRYAARIVSRAVLFVPGNHAFAGIGQFGVELNGQPADEPVRNIAIPRDHPSILADVAAKKGLYRGPLPSGFWNELLVRQLGGRAPREAIIVPAMIEGEAVAILYGDNLPSDAPIGQVGDLEAVMVDACLSLARGAVALRATTR
jgi:Domain of unknown function (DUF4388)